MCSIKSTHTNCSSSEWTELGFVLAAPGVLHGPGSQSPEVHDYLQGQWIIRARLESPEQTLLWWWTVWSLTLESADRNPWSHGQLPDQGGHIQSNPKIPKSVKHVGRPRLWFSWSRIPPPSGLGSRDDPEAGRWTGQTWLCQHPGKVRHGPHPCGKPLCQLFVKSMQLVTLKEGML